MRDVRVERFGGKTVIVTGGGSGFGEAIAKRFARERASVVVADIDAERADRVVAQITAAGAWRAAFAPTFRTPSRYAR